MPRLTYRLSLKNVSDRCNAFAESSSLTQRPYRSGGTVVRSVALIKADTFIGKLAEETMVKFFFANYNLNLQLDYNIYPRGVWDQSDLKYMDRNIHLAVKGVKYFSSWLLVEKKDIDAGRCYDYYALVKIDETKLLGEIAGFCSVDKVKNGYKLLKGRFIPGTRTKLDASNYGVPERMLINNYVGWEHMARKITAGELFL